VNLSKFVKPGTHMEMLVAPQYRLPMLNALREAL